MAQYRSCEVGSAVVRHCGGDHVERAASTRAATITEDEVLRLFGSASSTRHIAEQLGLDRKEVVREKDAAMRKRGFTTRRQAMAYVQSRTSRLRN